MIGALALALALMRVTPPHRRRVVRVDGAWVSYQPGEWFRMRIDEPLGDEMRRVLPEDVAPPDGPHGTPPGGGGHNWRYRLEVWPERGGPVVTDGAKAEWELSW